MEHRRLVCGRCGLSISGSGLYDCEENMKTMGIIGVVVCAIGIIGSATMDAVTFLWAIAVYGFFLALSIMAIKSE